MTLERELANVVLSMRTFQKDNFIRNQCITNCQYLYDCIKNSCINYVKVKSVIVISINNDDNNKKYTIVAGHLIVVLDDDCDIDPSYDVFSLKNKLYFDNIKDFMKRIRDKSIPSIKVVIANFLKFIKYADDINNSKLLISDKSFYNEQANYIDVLTNK